MSRIDDKVAYLEDERKKLWAKVTAIEKKQFVTDTDLQNLEADAKKKTSDYEESAKQSSKKASEFRNRCEDSKNASIQFLEETTINNREIEKVQSAVVDLHSTISEMHIDSIAKKTPLKLYQQKLVSIMLRYHRT